MTWEVIHGDCLDVMRGMDAGSVDAVVTDPPYGIRFMGKAWDAPEIEQAAANHRPVDNKTQTERPACMHAGQYDLRLPANRKFQAWTEAWAREALRVLKPGGHLLAFGGTRTYHRLTCAVEDAGFEIRDCIAWMYGSGFPKSLDVSKAIDKAAGAEREVVGRKGGRYEHGFTPESASPLGRNADRPNAATNMERAANITAPATDAAKQWDGWGTALKPAFEPIVVARKPLIGTVAANVEAHGTGALNVDGCRVGGGEARRIDNYPSVGQHGCISRTGEGSHAGEGYETRETTEGRWPANVVLDEDAGRVLDEQSGHLQSGLMKGGTMRAAQDEPGSVCYGTYGGSAVGTDTPGDSGGASRFFYCAKASRAERGDGNHHPTVKPVDLMRWLVRLVTPPKGTVLDPFLGSGTTGIAAHEEGCRFIGIEREAEYVEIARRRIEAAAAQGRLF